MRVADYIVQRLHQEGVDNLFMVTGRGTLFLTDAAAKEEGMECISVHHEQAAAYAAMAYAQKNEKIGACMVSTGCASTNAITPVLCAWQDDVPMVVVSGQNTLAETTRHTGLPIRTYGQQEADIIQLVESITKYAQMITDPDRIVYEVEKALHCAQSGRKGPVWIDVPLDIQNMRIEPDELERFVPPPVTVKPPSSEDIKYVVEALKRANRPVLLLGSGIRSSGAEVELRDFVEANPIPVVYGPSAPDVFRSDNELSIGAVGSLSPNRAANFALQNSDFVMVLGCRLTSLAAGTDADKFARAAKIVAVDIDPYVHKKGTAHIDKVILADVKKFLELLQNESVPEVSGEWLTKCKHFRSVFPKCEEFKQGQEVDLYYLSECLSTCLSEDATLVVDSGLIELILPTTVSFRKRQRCIETPSQGAMGYALPAAIGAYYGGAKDVVAVIGDGSVMMNLQELQTISYNKLPLKILIVNNNCYAVIRKRQEDLFRTRTIGTDESNGISCPDFKKVAKCFGLGYRKISNTKELDSELSSVLNSEGAVICEIMGLENQNYIHSSFARTSSGKFAQRPLEDQSPFLDREVFLSEMLIDPIDQ